VTAYRIYTLSRYDRVRGPPRVIDCPDDDSAMHQARKFMDGRSLELWDGPRLVGRLNPDLKEND
jgi:hypothetical protein